MERVGSATLMFVGLGLWSEKWHDEVKVVESFCFYAQNETASPPWMILQWKRYKTSTNHPKSWNRKWFNLLFDWKDDLIRTQKRERKKISRRPFSLFFLLLFVVLIFCLHHTFCSSLVSFPLNKPIDEPLNLSDNLNTAFLLRRLISKFRLDKTW